MDQNNSFAGIFFLPVVVLAVIFIVAGWKVFTKAGKPGWGILIPYYNLYLMVKIAGMSGWWFWGYLIPFVNLVVALLVGLGIAKGFGRSSLFGILFLWLFQPIGLLILGFGSSQYHPEVVAPPPVQPPPVQSPPTPASPAV